MSIKVYEQTVEKDSMKSPIQMPLRLVLGLSLILVFFGEPLGHGQQGSGPATSLIGQTVTLLPDGQFFVLGGIGDKGPVADAELVDPRSLKKTLLPQGLQTARAWHSATLLPDGSVLIVGGIDEKGQTIETVERFDPTTKTFATVPTTLVPRAHHTATLLTEGRVLIAGGKDETGHLVEVGELWDSGIVSAERLPSGLQTPRADHTATLLPDGNILFSGGVDQLGSAITLGELFDPIRQSFTTAQSLPAGPPLVPTVEGSLPGDGAVAVPTNSLLALRFSSPLQVQTVNGQSVLLLGPKGEEKVNVVPAEGGMLAFLTPQAALQPNASYTIELKGLADRTGALVVAKALTFTTGEGPASLSQPSAAGDLGLGTSGAAASTEPTVPGQMGRPPSPWQAQPPLQAAPGMTAVAGQVLTVTGQPLANVTVEMEAAYGSEHRTVRTDGMGRFLITDVMPGLCELVIDGRTADRPGFTYGIFEIRALAIAGHTAVLPYTIWMPTIDTVHAVRMASPTTSEVVVTSPRLPGLELHIPPGTIIKDHEGKVVTEISMTPIDLDRPPFPFPDNVIFPMHATIQPGGAYLYNDRGLGAYLVYGNPSKAPPGSRAELWHYDPEERGWYVYGYGTVSQDGRQIRPEAGVSFYEFTGTGACFGCGVGAPPSIGPAPGNGAPPPLPPPKPPKPGKPPKDKDEDKDRCCDPVDLGTGLFVLSQTDLFLPDVLPIVLARTYRPQDTVSRPFGIGATHPYRMYLWSSQIFQDTNLILPDGGRIHYVRISPGTSHTDGVYEHTASPTIFYKSIIKWNGHGWNLTLKDGSLYEFGSHGDLASIQDRSGNKVTISYSDQTAFGSGTGRITKVASPNGRWIEFTYDTYLYPRITQVKDNLGRTVSYTYDGSGRLWKVTDPAAGVTEYTYDTSHRMLTLKDARGIVFLTNAYDANGRVTQQTQADGTTYQLAYTVDGTGKITQTDVTDPRVFLRRVTFNTSGYTLTDTYAVGSPEQQTITYNVQANTNLNLSVTDGLSRQTAYAYDAMGNVTSVTALAGTPQAMTTTYTYEPTFNLLASLVDPLNHTTSFTYDVKGNLTTLTNALGQAITFVYNAKGQPISVTDPLNNATQLTYDAGDLTGTTNPLSQTTTRFTDSVGRVLSLTNALGNSTTYDYTALNRLTKVTDPLNGQTTFAYDPNGNLLSLMDAKNQTTTYGYNTMDRLATRTDPLTHAESYTYDANGNLTQVTDRKAQITTLTYDALNRRTQATYAGGATTTYTYDAGNRLTQIVDSVSGTITRAYDNLDRLTQEVTPQGTVNYTYDAAGRRTSLTVAGQPTVTYTYDNANRLTQTTQGTSTVTLAYDNAGRRTSLTLPTGNSVLYAYDAASRLTSLTYKQGTTVLGDLAYTYDAAGNRTVVGGSFARTGLPQAVASATYNANNQQLTFGNATLTYDFNGNQTTATDPSGSATYTWDSRNRLTGITAPGLSTSFGYDALGRRSSKTINGSSTSFLYDVLNPVQELAGTTPVANLMTGLGIDEYFMRTDGAGSSALLTDALGSTVALADATGTVQTQYTYEPFGGTAVSGQANNNTFKYTGREDDGTGLYFYRARYYSPRLQRFINEDPIKFLGGDTNLYAYVWNGATGLSDPSGLWGVGTVGGATGGGGAGYIGAAGGISIGAGIFGGGTEGLNYGSFLSLGGFAGGPGYAVGYPSSTPGNFAVGGYAGGGLGVFFTNATSPADLSLTTATFAFDIGLGPVNWSFQWSYGNGIHYISITPPYVSYGEGVNTGVFPSQTTVLDSIGLNSPTDLGGRKNAGQ